MANVMLREICECDTHTIPFYTKDILDNLRFAGTLTLVIYKGKIGFLTAKHCICERYDYKKDGLFLITKNGEINISNYIYYLYRDKEIDLIIILSTFIIRDHKYILLDDDNHGVVDFSEFFWVGFPIKKSPNEIRKEKNVMSLFQEKYTRQSFDNYEKERSSLNQSLIACIPFSKFDGDYIQGEFNLKNIQYYYEGSKEKGYSLKGMSGGLLFYFSEKKYSLSIQFDSELEAFLAKPVSFHFLGIGIEHKKELTILGITKQAIVKSFQKITEEINTTPNLPYPIIFTINIDEEIAKIR